MTPLVANDKELADIRSQIDAVDFRTQPAANALFLQIQDYRREAQIKTPPPILYHYTDTAGLIGIIQNNKLWSTHINYLNDASELLHARTLVDTLLQQREAEAETEILREFFRRARLSFDFSRTLDVFVSCFCEEGDLLSQWRGYARGGEGYSIGLAAQKLMNLGGFGFDFFLGRVVYDRATQEQVVEQILSMTLAGLRHMLGKKKAVKSVQAEINHCCRVFQQSIWFSMVVFKNETFKAENEWRAIRLLPKGDQKAIQFRSAGSKLIPYVELDFSKLVGAFDGSKKLPIKQIFHGPTLNPGLSGEALRMLLRNKEYGEVEVLGSKIPLRL